MAAPKDNRISPSVALTGRVYDWNDQPSESRLIAPEESDTYEEKRWIVLRTPISNHPGKFSAYRLLSFQDGDIQLQQKSDWLGRENQKGGHANYGYSGYFKLYVYVDNRRRRLVDFWKLFPDKEHHFDQQGQRQQVIDRIRATVLLHAGRPLSKGKGGWMMFPEADTAEPSAGISKG